MIRPKCPCVKDCPNRTATCHGQCERYSVYEIKMKRFYDEKNEVYLGLRPNNKIIDMMDRKAKDRRKGYFSVWKGE